MAEPLFLSKDLRLPIEVAGQVIALVGIRNSGKTNSAGVIAEELLDRNQQVVFIDPTDGSWGLRSGYPIFIFGGPHGDIPLAETDGKGIAEFVVMERVPLILSLRHLRKAGQRRFVTEFCEEIYHLKGKPEHRSPLTVFIDEAPLFVPQRVMGETARVVGAVEDLCARGRNTGFGVVLVTQRPATINKDVLSQADTIIAHRLISPQDRKALGEWLEENASAAELKTILSSLAGMPKGQAWVWAPSLDIMRQVQIRKRRTFDSSASPAVGEVVRPPKHLHEVNLDSLKAKLAANVERAKAEDPKALRAELAAVKAELARVKAAAPVAALPERVEVPVLTDAQVARLEQVVVDVRACHVTGRESLDAFLAMGDLIATAIRTKMVPPTRVFTPPLPRPSTTAAPRAAPSTRRASDLTAGEQRILDTIAMLGVRGIPLSREAVARWMGIHPNGGRYNTQLGALRAAGLLEGLRLTASGQAAAQSLPTGIDATMAACQSEGQRRILIAASVRPLSREELAGALGIHPNGGRFNTDLGWLRTMGVIPERGAIAVLETATR